jgi:hypothetical protein
MAADSSTGTKKKDDGPSKRPRSDIDPLVLPSLYRVTEGIPRRELKLMVSEANVCEAALQKELQDLQEALLLLKKNSNDNSNVNSNSTKENVKTTTSVDLMLETELTPPDRYYTVSALLGRLRDDLAMPLPPNSTLPALRAQAGLLQPPPTKKKKKEGDASTVLPFAATEKSTVPLPLTTLDKQKRVLAMLHNPEYRKPHATPTALLTLWKKLSTHRASVVFRRPVNPKEAPGYVDRIFFPIDLTLVRKMIVSRIIKSYFDFHQRIGLICHNCMKYNGRYETKRLSRR